MDGEEAILRAPRPSTLDAVLTGLYARVPLGMRLGLSPMRAACARAGNPEQKLQVVHVAGTNGKGSTCAMIESMARAGGKKTGLYTSPHLCRFAERIRIDGEPITYALLTDVLGRALDLGPDLSFFETATLAAFLAFAEAGVELAILEVGIGGRLDATNVIERPRVTAITRVARDHVEMLGNTLEEIVREKAGIAKQGVPLVLGPMTPELRAAALEVALAAGALPIVMGDDRDAIALDSLPITLRGAYQQDNARIATRVARVLGIGEAERRAGLLATSWPGRFEHLTIPSGRWAGTWLLDGAHNPDGAAALVTAVEEESARGLPAPGALVFGALADKEWPEMLAELAKLPCPRVYACPQGRMAATPAELAAQAPGAMASSVAEALDLARAAAKHHETPVVVCGSLYLVGEARSHLLGLPRDPPVAL
ncbi:MAG: Dihydrofolate synthase [Labilithrix sp.]|nr:Dihydrofolate synthase [Labilithrix sp.]